MCVRLLCFRVRQPQSNNSPLFRKGFRTSYIDFGEPGEGVASSRLGPITTTSPFPAEATAFTQTTQVPRLSGLCWRSFNPANFITASLHYLPAARVNANLDADQLKAVPLRSSRPVISESPIR